MTQEQAMTEWAKADAETAARIVRNIGQIASDATLAVGLLSSRMIAGAVQAIGQLATTPWQVVETNWGPRIICPDWKMTRGVGTGDAWLELTEIGAESEEGFSWISIAVGADITRLGLEFVFRPGLLDHAEKATSEDKRIAPLLNLGMVRDEARSRLFFPIKIDAEELAKGFEARDLEQAIAPIVKATRMTGVGGKVMVTANVKRITGFDPAVLAQALATYDGFDRDNDPHGERDFGDLTLWGYDLLWKIDYYDPALEFGSDDPADSQKTRRLLTVMLAADW